MNTDTAPEAATLEPRADGWFNAVTGMGADGHKDTSTYFQRGRILQPQELADMYYGDDLSYRIVSLIVRESLATEPTLKNKRATPDQVEAVTTALRALGWVEKFTDAGCYSRLFGNAGVFIACNGTQSAPISPGDKPLFLKVVDRRNLIVGANYANPTSEKDGTPELYGLIPVGSTFNGTFSGIIHESRIAMMRGTRLDTFERMRNGGWDYSILNRCINAVTDMGETWAGISYLLREISLKVFKLKGLAKALTTNPGGTALRLQMVNEGLATNRLLAVDSEDEGLSRVETGTLTGIAALVEQLLLRLSAAAEMPVTRLYGRAPSGLNSTGEYDAKTWAKACASYQTFNLKPSILSVVEQVARFIAPECAGSWDIEFAPVESPTGVEIADERNKIADMDVKYIGAQVFSPESIAVRRASGDWRPDYEGVDVSVQKSLIGQGTQPPPAPPVDPGAPDPTTDPPPALPGAPEPVPGAVQ